MHGTPVQRIVMFLVVGLFLLAPGGSGEAATFGQVIDFSQYSNGTPADEIDEPGVTLMVTQGAAQVFGGQLRLNPDFNSEPSSLSIFLAREATAITFPYRTFGNCGFPINRIQLYNNGAQVDELIIHSCDRGTYTRTLAFDEIRIIAGRVSNIEAMVIGNISLTYLLTKEDCKNGGWRTLGYRNQGECIKAAQH